MSNEGTSGADDLRLEAEARVRATSSSVGPDQKPEEIQRMLHELLVHQVELEMQNEEMRRTRAVLEEAVSKNVELFDFAPVGYFNLSPTGNILQANLAAAALLGIDRSECVGLEFAKYLLPRFQKEFTERLAQVFAGESVGTWEGELFGRQQRPTAVLFDWSLASNGVECHVTAIDINERKRSERDLEAARAFSRATIDSISAQMCVLDSSGTVVAVNRAWREFAARNRSNGQPPVDTIGSNYIAVCEAASSGQDQADGAAVADGIRRVSRGELVEFSYEYTCHGGGESRWFRVLVTRFADDSGHVVVSHESMTAEHLGEESRQLLREQLAQTSKMEALGRLAGGIAHDFNNMLAVILLNCQLASSNPKLDAALAESLTEIHDAAERSAALTKQLLTFARKQPVNSKLTDLAEAISPTFKMLARTIGEDVDFRLFAPGDLWLVRVDQSQLDQVLTNLCLNARDALSGPGRVTVGLENVTVREPVAGYRGRVPAEFVCLSVEDSGRGMSGSEARQIFEPFYTTKSLGSGTGLGLALVHGAVSQAEGFVEVDSEPGRGTTLRCYFPRHYGEKEGSSVHFAPVAGRGNGATVLVLDDEPAILRVCQRHLERLGYRVLIASSPSEAIRLAEDNRRDLRLLVTDVVMPEIDGRELARQIRLLIPGLAVVFMSGYTPDFLATKTDMEGEPLLPKPFSLDDLAAVVDTAMLGDAAT